MHKTVPKLNGESYVHILSITYEHAHIYFKHYIVHTACGDGKGCQRAHQPVTGFEIITDLYFPCTGMCNLRRR